MAWRTFICETSMPVRDRLIAHEKKLYRDCQRELTQLMGPKSKEILAYEKSFASSLPNRARTLAEADLARDLRAAEIIVVGDFHAFAPAQQEFLRVLQLCAGEAGFATVALECVASHQQSSLDNFLHGLITLSELRDEIDFDQNWRFPWENYREIFSHAKDYGWRLLALNHTSPQQRLKTRDLYAAEQIAEEIRTFGPQKIFVLFGELHLARPHLPKALRKTLGVSHLRLILLHQNLPAVYWKNAQPGTNCRQLLKIGPDEYCLLTTSPARKLRSYLNWAEGSNEDELDEPS